MWLYLHLFNDAMSEDITGVLVQGELWNKWSEVGGSRALLPVWMLF